MLQVCCHWLSNIGQKLSNLVIGKGQLTNEEEIKTNEQACNLSTFQLSNYPMNIELLRKSIKVKWLDYYQENRPWLVQLGVWVNSEGQRRPSSSFILATLSILEPRLTEMLPLIVDLNNDPNRIVEALGLNFNPDVELNNTLVQSEEAIAPQEGNNEEAVKMLPSGMQEAKLEPQSHASNLPSLIDESCRGVKRDRD
ncbi:DUF5331 domain-containing protein [Funiculus sociatus]|uniref:DUF5331 domain-containing protein n=1 Tax=Funiculus sociatus TaxID=450527 RepID=UPI00329776CA